MARNRYPFRERVTLKAAGTTDELTYTPSWRDALTFVSRWAVEDATTNVGTQVRSVIRGHGYDHPLNEQKTPVAATLYWDDRGTFIVDGESLVAVFVGATAADALALYVEGWYEPLDDEGA